MQTDVVMRWVLLLAAVTVASPGFAGGAYAGTPLAAVGPAIDRAALGVRAPDRAVILSAAVAGQRLIAVGERGLVIAWDQASARWQQLSSPTSVTLTTVRFVDDLKGMAVGHGGVVLVTADGGASWQRRLDGKVLAQLAVDDAKASGDAARIREAERLVADGLDKPLLDVLVWDAQRFLVVGAYGIAFRTVDGGATWQSWMGRLPNPKGLHLYVVRRLGDKVLVAGEQGLLLHSADGGESFKPVSSPYRGSWFAAEMLSESTWVVAGLRGNVWRTDDAGATWSQSTNPVPASIAAAVRAADGRVLLASQAGYVLQADGSSVRPLNEKPMPPLVGLVFDANRQLWALTLAGPIVLPAAGR